MMQGHDNCTYVQSLTCSSKTECGSDLEQSSIESEDNSLSIGARTMCWDHESVQKLGQCMADIWQFTLTIGCKPWLMNISSWA